MLRSACLSALLITALLVAAASSNSPLSIAAPEPGKTGAPAPGSGKTGAPAPKADAKSDAKAVAPAAKPAPKPDPKPAAKKSSKKPDAPVATRTFFRKDGGDETAPWFVLADGEFPPEGSAHYFAGELIRADHLERTFVLRVDRTDAQNRGNWDLPSPAVMLPYGTVRLNGSPADIVDIPLGTHLHGWFHVRDPANKTRPTVAGHTRIAAESQFDRCLLLEDDFSHHARQKQLWRVDAVDLTTKRLTATLMSDGKPVDKTPKLFDLTGATRAWRGKGVVPLDASAVGKLALFNLTWATLYGPGRVTEIWLDDESRALAAAHQLERHRLYIRDRGLPGWVDEVDNQKRLVTVTLFGGVDPSLLDVLKQPGASAGLAVAEANLLMYDPVNDRKSGGVVAVKSVPVEPGSSGLQITVKPDLLLEGYRPKRIVRVYPGGWPVVALPREEELFGRE